MTSDQTSKAEIIRAIRRILYGPTLADVVRQTGVGRSTVYRIAHTGRLSDGLASRLKGVVQIAPNEPDHNRRSASIYEPARGILRDLQR